MKYAVIAALLATTTSAATGCKPGIEAKAFDKKGCKGDGAEMTRFTKDEISKTGECQGTAPKLDKKTKKNADVEVLKDSEAKLKTLEKTLTDAETKLKTEDDEVKMKEGVSDTKGKLPTLVLKKAYAPLEKAYFKKMASKEKFDAYKNANENIKS